MNPQQENNHMAKTQAPNIPAMEFKHVFEPANVEDAVKVIENAREGTLVMVPFDAIHPIADFNIRVHTPDYEEHVERIKDSIKKYGFFRHMPLKVFPAQENGQNLLYLAGGYTRFDAAKRAVAEGYKMTRLPVVPTQKGTTMDDLLIGLDRDNDGRPLTPFEKGILVKRLQALDNDEDEIATALGVTKRYVSRLLTLMAAPKQIHNMVIGGEVSAELAIDLIAEHGSGKKAVEVLKAAGATGERPTPNGQAGEATTRVTRSRVAGTGGTQKAGKKLYEALIEYLIVLGGTSGAQSAYDFLLKWHEKDPEAVKELARLAKPKKGKKGKKAKEKSPKDVRQKITDDMTDEQKKAARDHNKVVKKRAERRAARKATKEATEAKGEGTPASEDDPI
jgi:ParB family chromosome partitioning protein